MGYMVGTAERIRQARTLDRGAPGPRLGEIAMRCNASWSLIAKMLGVSRPTVYRWVFGGSKIGGVANLKNVERLIELLSFAYDNKYLPAEDFVRGLKEAKAAYKKPFGN